MEKNYLEELNPNQKQAATQTEGPVLIVAGAGAGKTKTITYRILHLIRQGVAPEKILAITFTNKAANEMAERVARLLGEDKTLNRPIGFDGNRPFLGTFHSLGTRILRENYKEASIPKSFKIYDRGDSARAIKNSMKIAGIDPKSFEPGKILSVISREKGDAVTAGEFEARGDNSYFRKLVGRIWLEYEKILVVEKALDFDDLLLKTVGLLRQNAKIREFYQTKWQYIHVDEYQDTNKVQYELVNILSAKHKNICVVGDMDQAIYGWRGADIKNLLDFEKDFPETKTILLEENYRSTQNILTVANRIIEKNKIRKEKRLFTKNGEGEKLGMYPAYDETDEANFVSSKVRELISKGTPAEEIAVLYRANFQSRALEEAMLANNITYQVIGTRFFERKEIKDVVAYLRAAIYGDNAADWERIVNVPPRGIGKVTLAKIVNNLENKLTPAVAKKVSDFRKLLSEIKASAEKSKLSETIKMIIRFSGMEKWLKDEGLDGEERLENLKELASLATKYDKDAGLPAAERFLEDAALASDQDEMDRQKNAVRLMTVHASKGLEFDYIFITGLEEDLFPHKRINENKVSESEAEEERRLFYVAITRARKKIYLSYANIRTIFGMRQPNVPSEFLFDIDEEFLDKEEPLHLAGGKTIYFD